MLLRFDLTNFGAFRDQVSLRLNAPATTDAEVRAAPLAPRTPLVAMIYGPNASGKTTLLDGLAQLVLAVRNSHRLWDPAGGTTARPFLLQDDATTAPTVWRVQFTADDSDGVPGVFAYDLAMDARAVRHEQLRFRSADTRRWRRVFRRDEQLVLSSHATLQSLAARMRPNALLLSLAAQENEPITVPAWQWFADQVQMARNSLLPNIRQHAMDELVTAATLPAVRGLVARADLGIEDVRGVPLTAREREEMRQLSRRLADAVPGASLTEPSGEFRELEFAHRGAGDTRYWLPQNLESDGTHAFLATGLIASRALAIGGVLVVDELDSSLHPSLVEAIVETFRSPISNPLGGQLLASTHDTHLFGRNSTAPLSRHEVWFTEKSVDGAASLFRLSDFPDARPDLDKEHWYLAGRYGAVPTPNFSGPWSAGL